MFLCFSVLVLSFPVLAVEDFDEAWQMEKQAEEQSRPYGLGVKVYNPWYCRLANLPLIGTLLGTACRFKVDADEVQPRHSPSKVELDLPAEPEEENLATMGASLEGAEAQAGLGSIIDWLLQVIGVKTGGEKGLLTSFWPKHFVDQRKKVAGIEAAQEKEADSSQVEKIVSDHWFTEKALLPYELQSKRPAEYVPPPEEIPTVVPTLPPIISPPPAVSSLADLFTLTGEWAGVPWGVIEAVARIEGGHLFDYSDSEIIRYSQPGGKDPINCTPNICSAAGPMQLTTGKENADCSRCPKACEYDPNAWAAYKNAVNEATGEGREPNVCNIKDSIFAATKKMKIDSGTPFGEEGEWGKKTVRRVATRYYGECWCCPSGGDEELCRLGKEEETFACQRLGKSYCEFVWDYYQTHQ